MAPEINAINFTGIDFLGACNPVRFFCEIRSDVFSGLKDVYREIDISDSHTILGKTKSAGEFYLEKNSLDYLIFRCCQLYGRSLLTWRPNFFEYVQQNFIKGNEINCDNLLSYGHLDVNYLGMIIELAINKNLRNLLLQVCSKDISTFYKFAESYCKTFGENPNLLKKGRWDFPTFSETEKLKDRERSFKMVVENLENYLNISVPTIEESLRYTFERFVGQDRDNSKELNL